MIEAAAFLAFAVLVVGASLLMDRRSARRDARRRNHVRRLP